MLSVFRLGFLFLCIAFIFLVCISVSAPASHSIGFMNVVVVSYDDSLTSTVSNIVFGIFGYCITTPGGTVCWKTSGIAYDIVETLDPIGNEDSVQKALHVLTGFLVLYPIAAGLSFVACLTALAVHYIGGGWSVIFASMASVAALLALIMTFVMFTIFKHHIDSFWEVTQATFINATWFALVAFLMLFVGTIIVFRGWRAERRRHYQFFLHPAQETIERGSQVPPPQEMVVGPSLQTQYSTSEVLES